jgi:hypothetical protein
VLLLALVASVVIGAGVLFPAFMMAWSADRAVSGDVAVAKSERSKGNLANIEHELSSDESLIGVLSDDAGAARFSDIIRSIVAESSSVSITSLDLARQATSTIVATISGTASTRDDLLSWKSRLEKLTPGATVDLPIDDLKDSADIAFSIRFTEYLQ